MKKLVATWTPSVSADAVLQEVVVKNGLGEVVATVELGPEVSTWSSDQANLVFGEGATVTVEITVVDAGGNRSATVSETATVPDVEPAPITGLTLSFEDVAAVE